MPSGRVRSPGRRVHVRSGAEALTVARRVTSRPARPETVALLLDDCCVCRACLVVEGTTEPDDVLSLARLLAEASEREASIHAVVLVSVRRHAVDAAAVVGRRGRERARDDVDRLLELLELFDGVGVELLDWFVLAGGAAASLRALTGLPSSWPAAPECGAG
jgi:hypothetical protein